MHVTLFGQTITLPLSALLDRWVRGGAVTGLPHKGLGPRQPSPTEDLSVKGT